MEKGESDALKDSEDLESGMDSELKAQLDDKQKNTEQPQELKQTEQAAEDTKKETEALGMNKGGEVPGTGDKDTVPAMLTPGEFVMSKDAVEQYGVDTMEGLNAAAGGTNIPTLMGGFNEGGAAVKKPMTTEELVTAAGPSLQMFMEHNNAAIDSDPDAIYGEHMRMELDRDGKMINFGKTIANMSEWAFNTGVEQIQNNEAIDPDVKEALLKKMAWVRKETLENPNFKSDMAFDINKDIPGTAANRLYLKAQNSPENIAIKAGIDPAEVARLWNRRGMSGGGLVLGYRGGGLIKGLSKVIKRSRDVGGSVVQSALKMAGVQGIGSNVSPPTTPGGRKVTTIAIPGGPAGESTPPPDNGGKKIPAFSASAKNSQRKIRTLGITL